MVIHEVRRFGNVCLAHENIIIVTGRAYLANHVDDPKSQYLDSKVWFAKTSTVYYRFVPRTRTRPRGGRRHHHLDPEHILSTLVRFLRTHLQATFRNCLLIQYSKSCKFSSSSAIQCIHPVVLSAVVETSTVSRFD
jgi:hypothetical protein